MANGQLTAHFTLKELTATSTGYDNTPTNQIVDNLGTLAQALEKVRTACNNNPIRVLSGYRSPDVNTAVKGSKTSAHMKGLAADFTVGNMSLKQVFETLRKSGIVYDQLILEPTWIHIGLAAAPRKQDLIYDGKSYVPA
jgi:zinc D-Ala-D-Ala carboxypeptidase